MTDEHKAVRDRLNYTHASNGQVTLGPDDVATLIRMIDTLAHRDAELAEVRRELDELVGAVMETSPKTASWSKTCRGVYRERSYKADATEKAYALAARIKSAQPKGEWIDIEPDNIEGSDLPDSIENAYWLVAWSFNGRIRCEWSKYGAVLWRAVPPRPGYNPVAYWSIPHIPRRPDIPEYKPKENRDEQ